MNRRYVIVDTAKVKKIADFPSIYGLSRRLGVSNWTAIGFLEKGGVFRKNVYKFCVAYNVSWLDIVMEDEHGNAPKEVGGTMSNKRTMMPVDIEYIRKMTGSDNIYLIAGKMGVSNWTVTQMIRDANASMRTILKFCKAYGAEHEKVIAQQSQTKPQPAVKESIEVISKSSDDIAVVISKSFAESVQTLVNALTEQTKMLAIINAEANSCKERLCQISDRLSVIENAQREFGEYSKRYSSCTYKTLKEFKEMLN